MANPAARFHSAAARSAKSTVLANKPKFLAEAAKTSKPHRLPRNTTLRA
jgi:hypothetical protein